MSSEIKEIQNNKIIKIKVKSLFGLFDYDIPLNDNGVTILIGVNGSGKSTIFKILHNILNEKFYNILDVDFKLFEIYFEGGDIIKCERRVHSADITNLSLNVKETKRLENYDKFCSGIQNIWNQSKILEYFLISISSKKVTRNHKLISSEININKSEVNYEVNEITGELKLNFDELATESRFIETQRLQLNYTDFDNHTTTFYERNYLPPRKQLRLGPHFEDYDVPISKSRIQEYADDLSGIIKAKRSNYFAQSQDVEKKTLSEYLGKTNIDITTIAFGELKDIENNLSEMDDYIIKLSKLGIYNPAEMSLIKDSKLLYGILEGIKKYLQKEGNKVNPSNFNKLLNYSIKCSLLKLYTENMKKRLEIFEELVTKIEIFTTHINTLFEYKEMKVDLEKGFIFHLNDGLEKGRIINPIDLSAGEQHEVVLNYELIFKTDKNSVILVDEPEISLHMLWQRRFIDNLLDIAKKNSLNIIVATHSPDIVMNHRNLVCVLSEI